MENVIKFNKTAIDALQIPATGRVVYGDPSAPTGLRMRVTANGAKAWYWMGRSRGKPVSVKIGDYADVTPAKAIARAREINSGDTNPNEEKRAARDAATFSDLWTTYLETYAVPHKKPSSVEEDKRNWKKHLQKWGGGKRLNDITQASVKTLHTRIGASSGHYAANRVLALLSGMFSKSAKDLGFDPRDNPAHGVERFEEKERDRWLKPHELQALLTAIQNEEPTIRDFIKVSLFTGARRANVLSMKWEDVDLDRATWKIPGEVTKNGQPLIVPLHAEVVGILKKRPDFSPYVFPAERITAKQVTDVREMNRKNQTTREIAKAVNLSQTTVCRIIDGTFKLEEHRHLSPPRKAWKRVLDAAGIKERTTLHDLRRTFATSMVKAGASLTVIATALGHKDLRTTQKHYALVADETVRTATLASVDAMNATATVKEKKGKKTGKAG